MRFTFHGDKILSDELVFNDIAKLKLAILAMLAFLNYGEFVKNSIVFTQYLI